MVAPNLMAFSVRTYRETVFAACSILRVMEWRAAPLGPETACKSRAECRPAKPGAPTPSEMGAQRSPSRQAPMLL